MTSRHWEGTGPEFNIDWGGRVWTLRPEAAQPGLYAENCGPLLGLDGVAAKGRVDPGALAGTSLTECSQRFDHVEAIYRPPGWGDMTIRVLWTPTAVDEALDVLVELSARSVGDLMGVEVLTLSVLDRSVLGLTNPRRRMIPQDERCATLARDGREGDPGSWDVDLTPTNGELACWRGRCPAIGDSTYIALVHPHDVSRRIVDDTGAFVRFALFGHDLERGIVLRGRLRSFWGHGDDLVGLTRVAMERFLHEPPPLST